MIIYVDIIFLENFILDFIILIAISIIVNNKLKIKRLLFGGALGSVYTVFSLISGNTNIFLKVINSIFIVLISFGFKNKRSFVKNLGVFYLTTITFGGSSFMFLFLVNPKKVNYSSGFFRGIYPIEMTFLGVIFGFLLIIGVQKILKRKFSKICKIKIAYNGKSIETKALVDF